MTDFFNLIAEICSSVIRYCPENTFYRFTCISREAADQILAVIRRRFPAFFEPVAEDDSNTPEQCGTLPEKNVSPRFRIRQLEEKDIQGLDIESLTRFWHSFLEISDFYALIILLQVIDSALETILNRAFTEYQSEQFSTVLNTNREATDVGLLPRCRCIWERSNLRSRTSLFLDSFVSHFLLLHNEVLDDIVDIHHFLPDGFFPRFDARRKLVVAATPLRLNRHFRTEPYEEGMVQYFRVSYEAEHFAEDNELIWQKINAAAKTKSDILVFPEMLGNPETAAFICDRLKSLSPETRSDLPSLIVLPSVWDKERRSNTVTVTDRRGNVLCRQSKQIPYRMNANSDSFLEGISSNLVVNIFHYEGIGRIAILICKDFLMTQFMERLMRNFKLSLIIVPSFSTGSYNFFQSSDLCAHDDCNVVWVNSCAAMEHGKEANFKYIGYVRKRIGRSDDDAQKLCCMPICQGAFKGKCTQDCLYLETIRGV